MNAASRDVKDILEASSSLGLTYATDLFIAGIPKGATLPAVGIIDSGGEPSEAHDIHRPHFQLLARGQRGGYLAAHELLQDCRVLLCHTGNFDQGSTTYIGIWSLGGILSLGNNDRGEPMLSLNFRCQRTPA